ncbi:hypothetical protein HDV01_000731 [Terramyces sp. JEL0728]|nr:hypothetical protein HDV01_000731 [Terramyces sp. JEL0728]
MKKKGSKLSSLDKQFFQYAVDYQSQLKPDEELKKWNIDEIVLYAQRRDMSLKRKPQANLKNSCENALKHLRDTLESDDSADELEDGVQYFEPPKEALNAMNNSLLNLYSKSKNEVPKEEKKEKDSEEETGKSKRKLPGGKLPVKKPKLSADAKWPTPTAKLADLGGVDDVAQELLQLIGMPLQHPEIFRYLGIDPPRGILLHGPPGCGKTMLANAIAGEANVPFINIAAPVIVSGMSGESEKKIREVFEEAKELAPCILFIDEIDAITPKRETAQREMERRIVAQLLTCMDDISLDKTDYKPVIIIGATNRPDSLDPALRRAGRFDREIALGVPDDAARAKIIEKMCSKLKLDGHIRFEDLAKLTPGFVGADLNALMGEAGMIAVKRIFAEITHSDDMIVDSVQNLDLEPSSNKKISDILSSNPDTLTEKQLEPLCIRYGDFVQAVKKVQPSAKREGFATVPGVTWDDIGALDTVRDELRMAVVEPIKHPEYFKSVGITSSMGVLLYGPPGCGKTLLAKAVANESHCNFLSVKGPELLNKYVGESERAIRMVFARAQASSPCVIFFDELDAICPNRSNDAESQSSSRLVNTLLTEMDGMNDRKLVFVIAATNRPDMIDPAMLRPGRLDKALYVDLPNPGERRLILQTLTRKTPVQPNLDLTRIANDERCEGMSGADLAALVREASVTAVRQAFYSGKPADDRDIQVTFEHFQTAFTKVSRSVGSKDRKKYELLKVKFGSAAHPESK